MSDTYTTIGEALYDYMDELDISASGATWSIKLNRPPKADELSAYPAFAVVPARDGQDTGDTDTDADSISYYVWIIVSNREASASEEQLRKIVDIVRTSFRQLRHDPSPLHPSAFDIAFTGEWGGTPEQGERWYRLEVTTFVHETLVTEAP